MLGLANSRHLPRARARTPFLLLLLLLHPLLLLVLPLLDSCFDYCNRYSYSYPFHLKDLEGLLRPLVIPILPTPVRKVPACAPLVFAAVCSHPGQEAKEVEEAKKTMKAEEAQGAKQAKEATEAKETLVSLVVMSLYTLFSLRLCVALFLQDFDVCCDAS